MTRSTKYCGQCGDYREWDVKRQVLTEDGKPDGKPIGAVSGYWCWNCDWLPEPRHSKNHPSV